MKKYIEPVLEIIQFEAEDVITDSPPVGEEINLFE